LSASEFEIIDQRVGGCGPFIAAVISLLIGT
jgi:hypothetical protein